MTLIRQTAALIAVVQAWIIQIRKIVVRRNAYPLVSYGPMLGRDKKKKKKKKKKKTHSPLPLSSFVLV